MPYDCGFQPFWWSKTPRMHSSDFRNPCSHIYTGELKYMGDRSIFITSGGTASLRWRNPRVPGRGGSRNFPTGGPRLFRRGG